MPKIFSPLLLIACCFFAINFNNIHAKTKFNNTIVEFRPSSASFDFNISPNPAKDNINIEFTRNVSGVIFIHDSLGNQVFKLTINGTVNQNISLENLNNGIYFISVKTNAKTVIKRLIKY